MSGQATFGDFLDAAHRSLDAPPWTPEPVAKRSQAAARTQQVQAVTVSLYRLIGVMARYLDDITAAFGNVPARNQHLMTNWPRATVQAREALCNAAAFLRPDATAWEKHHGQPEAGSLARRIDQAAASLATGRDLLHTHFTPQPGGGRRDRSEWAPVVVSAPVTRALLGELAVCARRIAPQAADLALSRAPAQRSSGQARRQLNAACQWLWVLHAAIQSAGRQDPVSADEQRLLHAIPVNTPAPRTVPNGSEPVPALYQGTINSAERVRHHAWTLAAQPPWSLGLTVTSMRQVAATSTVTSHHCEMLLRSLAARIGTGQGQVSDDLLASADAAAHTRARWLDVAKALRHLTTDTRGRLSPAAIESEDLALWTGRLAYADPRWTVERGPAYPARSPQSLAPEPGDIPLAVAAVHQASHALARLARAGRDQAQAAARAGRFLVPTRSLPESYDIPHPFAAAPPDRIGALLSAYADACDATAETTTRLARAANVTRASSHVLTTARTAAADTGDPTRPPPGPRRRHLAAEYEPAHELPGAIERTLHEIGVTNRKVLLHGAAIDRAGQQLIIEAAEYLGTRPRQPAPQPMSRTAAQTEVINNILAAGATRAAALLRPPAPHHEQEAKASETVPASDPGQRRSHAQHAHAGVAARVSAPRPANDFTLPPEACDTHLSDVQIADGDWRDAVLKTERQSWQSGVMQPYASASQQPQAGEPEADN